MNQDPDTRWKQRFQNFDRAGAEERDDRLDLARGGSGEDPRDGEAHSKQIRLPAGASISIGSVAGFHWGELPIAGNRSIWQGLMVLAGIHPVLLLADPTY
jgi:hypothetical protein